ncbi:hypothetical protein QQ008_10205 [Fulvivirgaceae bacterium BMA10]|uniref:Uncharacterized protein n=1 Tax=Splendidivirga corallicola TaxID=3051826 RepID=A0ABT8KPX3_9BACT|nr:hypothetical protein [Fulvivirgaceae bacterium BMA10]
MKFLIVSFFLIITFNAHAQTTTYVVDSADISAYKLNKPKEKVQKQEKAEDDKSLIGLVGSLGKGLLNKFKRRFNLEELKEKVDHTKDKISNLGKNKRKEEQSDKPSEEMKEVGNEPKDNR